MQLRFSFLFSIFLFAFSYAATLSEGTLDLRSEEYHNEAVKVIGTVPFYWKQHLSFNELKTVTPSAELKLPGIWNGIIVDSTPIADVGYGTFALKVTTPDSLRNNLAISIPIIFSSYRLYLDSTLIFQCGDPEYRPEVTIVDYRPKVVEFSMSSDTCTLIFQVSNFTNDKGGPWHPLYIGSRSAIHRINELHFSYDFFLLGALFAFTLAYLFMAFIERKNLPSEIPLYFGLYSAVTLVRLLTMSSGTAYLFFPYVPTSIFIHLEFLGFFLAPLFYHSYIHHIYKPFSHDPLLVISRYFFLILTGFSLLTPQLIYTRTVVPVQIATLMLLLYHIYLSIRTFNVNKAKATVLFLSTIALIGAVVHDVLQVYSRGMMLPLIPLSSVVVAMFQSYFVSQNSAKIQEERAMVSRKLEAVNGTLSRFVPQKFFQLLNRTPATIQLGDQTNRKMSVLFCDIRNLSEIAPTLEGVEKFHLISSFLDEVSKIVVSYGGVIDKYIGDSLMAIFPELPENALQASFEIISTFYDKKDSNLVHSGIRPGIGIHYGMMTLGVIGNDQRMENTVIGDAVNTAARMRSLTHRFDTDLIVSNEVLNNGFAESDSFHLRSLGTLAVKGKRERTTIQEIFFVESSNESQKLHSRDLFEQAIVFYEVGRYEEAESLFESALSIFPNDPAAKAFIESCHHEGASILTSK